MFRKLIINWYFFILFVFYVLLFSWNTFLLLLLLLLATLLSKSNPSEFLYSATGRHLYLKLFNFEARFYHKSLFVYYFQQTQWPVANSLMTHKIFSPLHDETSQHTKKIFQIGIINTTMIIYRSMQCKGIDSKVYWIIRIDIHFDTFRAFYLLKYRDRNL